MTEWLITAYIPYCPAVTPPFLRPTARKKRGGVTTRTCAFASQLSPPPSLPRIRVLCSAVEDENSFDWHAVAVLKDGRVVGHVHVAIFCAGSLAARLLPPAATAGRRPQETVRDQRKRPRPVPKLFSTRDLLHLQHAYMYTCKNCMQSSTARVPQAGSSGPRGGGRVMEVI